MGDPLSAAFSRDRETKDVPRLRFEIAIRPVLAPHNETTIGQSPHEASRRELFAKAVGDDVAPPDVGERHGDDDHFIAFSEKWSHALAVEIERALFR